MPYIASQFGWFVAAFGFTVFIIYAGCVAFVIPHKRLKAKQGSNSKVHLSDKERVLIGGSTYLVSVIIFTLVQLIRLLGIVWWLSYSEGSQTLTVLLPGGGNATGTFLMDNTPLLNASWPVAIVLWALSALLFVFFALVVNDGHGYWFMHIFHEEWWSTAIGMSLLVPALICVVGTIVCFALPSTWPGYGKAPGFNGTAFIPLVTELVWAGAIIFVFVRQFLVALCFYGMAPHADTHPAPLEASGNED